jgi:hypothetical protein
MTAHRLGAVAYILWGIMHIMFAIQIFMLNIGDSTYAVVQNIYSDTGAISTPEELGDVIGALMNQHAWNLLWFGAFAAVVGALYNWRNSIAGYWGNLAIVSLADIGFIFAILLPGYVDLMVGIWGPILWIIASVFSTIGVKNSPITT